MIRELINRLSRSFSEKMVPARRPHTAPMRVWFDPDTKGERALEAARAECINGETVDLSRNGIAFSVPVIRTREKYLVNQDRPLNVEIDLPNGKVFLRMVGRRYEKVNIHSSMEWFFVGAAILDLTEQDKAIYENFLTNGPRRPSNTAERVGIAIK